MKQDRDVINLRHDNELRQAQNRAEEAFRKAQVRDKFATKSTGVDQVRIGRREQDPCSFP